MKELFAALIVFALFAAVYVGYRHTAVPSHAELGDWSVIQHLPATACSFTAGDFDRSQRGMLYIYKGNMRMSGQYSEGGRSVVLQVLVRSDGQMFSWSPGEIRGYVDPLRTTYDERVRAFHEVTCSPWWFPDESHFVLPTSVVFEELP